ncbi:hypothetical protein [Halobacillus andaensis]|uniref:hypothetical protein n=1 Tax=Halobacillus andaensis TaxID=1176239 RepID=UPI003D748FB2
MKKSITVTLLLLIFMIAGCSSSEDLSLDSLKENYPEAFAKPIEDSLSEDEQKVLGLPSELPFNVEKVEASSVENEAEVNYHSSSGDEVKVITVYNPENNLQEADTRMTLDSGVIAGVTEGDAAVFFEWYDDEDQVVYQMTYTPMEEEDRLERGLDIANTI